jgi:hypothetical protein
MNLKPHGYEGGTIQARDLDSGLNGEIWGICTCFNPAGFQNRYKHLRRFVSRVRLQGLRILLIELAFHDYPFLIEKSDSDCVLQVRSDSVLWQKERLLNIALQTLPSSCDKVIWMDGDLLFQNEEWVHQTAALLRRYPAVQCFERAVFLPDGELEIPQNANLLASQEIEEGAAFVWDSSMRCVVGGHTGLAWAARRDLLTLNSFYDRAIVGGGDTIMFWAMVNLSRHEPQREFLRKFFSKQLYEDVCAWSDTFYHQVAGNIGYTPGSVFHLWHGSRRYRKYSFRQLILRKAEFDPDKDIIVGAQQCWSWNSDKPELHRDVYEYFRSRREDG